MKNVRNVLLVDYKPRSELVVESHEVLKPRFPVVDFHTHFRCINNKEDTKKEIVNLYKFGIISIVNLDGFWGERLDQMMNCTEDYHNMFITFGSVDVTQIDDPNFETYACRIVEEGYKKGIKGLKFFKDVSLKYKDIYGNYIRIDDKRLKPIWETAARLRIPILIHIADPIAFFRPVDEYNERIEELNEHPDWSYAEEGFFTYQELMEMQEKLLADNPRTTFVIAHVGSAAENLGFVSKQLDKYPNMFVDIAARIAELGRQPYTARKFMIKYQDRILFGTDSSCNSNIYPYYYRFLETWDEYFDYDKHGGGQGRWKIYGLGLPNDVLEKIYFRNAKKLISSIDV